MSWEAALAAQSFSGANLVRGLPPSITLSSVLNPSHGCKIILVSGRSICIQADSRHEVCWMLLPELEALGLSLAKGGESLTLLGAAQEESPAQYGASVPVLSAPIYLGNETTGETTPPIAYLVSDISTLMEIPHLQSTFASAHIRFIDLRSLMSQLSPQELSRAGHAVAISQWHRMHPYCARCGGVTEPILAGAKRQCVNDPSHRHYPRTDPVIISLVVSPGKGDKALLGRSKGLREGTMTCLSGFIDQNESIEEAVAREIREESGIILDLSSVRVLGSQPWPIGRGGSCELMIGCIATAASEIISIDPNEMAECRWVSREEVKIALERSTRPESPFISGRAIVSGAEKNNGDVKSESTEFYVPPPFAIAYHLIKYWVDMESSVEDEKLPQAAKPLFDSNL